MEEEGVARERPFKAPASENAMDAMSGGGWREATAEKWGGDEVITEDWCWSRGLLVGSNFGVPVVWAFTDGPMVVYGLLKGDRSLSW